MKNLTRNVGPVALALALVASEGVSAGVSSSDLVAPESATYLSQTTAAGVARQPLFAPLVAWAGAHAGAAIATAVGAIAGAVVTYVLGSGDDGDQNEAWEDALDACRQCGGAPTNVSVGGDEWTFDCVLDGGRT